MTPTTPTKSDTLAIKGTVSNHTHSAIKDARVGLRIGQSLNSRSAIDTAARQTGSPLGAEGREVGKKHAYPIDQLPAGASRTFSLSIPMKDLHLGGDGVYELGVALTGKTAPQPYEHVLGARRTFLPWQSSASGTRTRVSVMWPLVSSTHLTAQTDSDQQQTRIFRNDSLASELAPGGRLQQMVALGKDLPVTWVVDPDLLATVEAMTKAYKVQKPDGSTVPGKGQAVAKQWLKDLQDAVQGHEVVALPFGDPDLASLAHRGEDVSGALGHLKPATDLASRTVETILMHKPRTDFAWPVDGAIDTSVVDVATSAGAHNVITRSDSLQDTQGLPYSPTAARPIGGGNRALVADARLSTAFEDDMSGAGDSTLAIQQFLAQTLMVNMQAPGKQRSIVVAPQRMPTADQARAMAEAVSGLKDGRWTEPLDLGGAAKAEPDPRAATHVPGSGSYPASLRKRELPTDAYRDIRRAQGSLDDFQVILSQPDRVVTPIGNAIMREMSTSWRGNGKGASGYRNSVQDYLSSLSHGIQLIQKSPQTLSGRSATIPVTVQNNLVQGVKGMKLVLTSSQPNRLEIEKQQPVKIEGGHSQSVKFDTTANANGTVWVTARLYTEDGTPYGAPMRFPVKATEITSTVMLVIAGGVLLLVLAGIRMYTQRKRAAGRNAAEDDDGPGGDTGTDGTDDTDGADGPGATAPEPAPAGPGKPEADDATSHEADAGDPAQPGDTAARQGETQEHAAEQQGDVATDTGPESGDPSGTGEKVDR